MALTDRGEFILDNKHTAVLPWNRTGYTYLKREGSDGRAWVSLVGRLSPVTGDIAADLREKGAPAATSSSGTHSTLIVQRAPHRLSAGSMKVPLERRTLSWRHIYAAALR